MDKAFFVILGGFVIVSLYWYFRILVTTQWIKHSRNAYCSDNEFANYDSRIYVLIPVLDEAERIEKTVEYFIDNFQHLIKFNIVLISTEREFDLFNYKTKVLLDRLASISYPQKIIEFVYLKTGIRLGDEYDNISIIRDRARNLIIKRRNTIDVIREISRNNRAVKIFHYPESDGKMANQLNYAINKIINENDDCNSRDIFCVYNADSRPHPKTFDWVLRVFNSSNVKVFQQYGNYLKNIYDFEGTIKSKILISAALWQTRWSIGFEIYNALRQLKFQDKKLSLNYPLNYCIGHGLFFTKDIYQCLGGFNEQMHNEDAIMGLELSYLGELIMPIPYFDESETPNSIIGLYKQKSNWFFGPLQAFSYYDRILSERNIGNLKDRLRLLVLSIKLFFHAVYWVSGPLLLTASFIVAIYINNLYFGLLFAIEVIIFLVIPNILTWFIVEDLRKIKFLSLLSNLFIGAAPCYFLHGLSAHRTLLRVLINKILMRQIIKEKTIMS